MSSIRAHSRTPLRAALPGSEASLQSSTSTIRSQRPRAWKPSATPSSARADRTRAEGVLELVAVAPLFGGADDRLHLEVVEPADPPQRVLHLGLLLGQLALVGEALPGRAGAGLAAVDAAVGEAVGAGAQQLDRPRLGEALLAFRHLGEDAVARQRRRRRRRRSRRPGRCRGRRRRASRSRPRAARRGAALVSRRLGARAAGSPPRGVSCAPGASQFLQLGEQRVGLFAAAFEQLAEHLLGVAVESSDRV